ncbi:MAG: hypothetical protein BM555_04115 [Crocinitomix sp. MedPE-SWsnd]|nr:MAG: hypothetical protein BM555_04115 [Crocinitomix sp. MedPE-SWsnd]
MDKRSITGLILIAGILIAFAIFSPKPDPVEEDTAQTEQNDSTKTEDNVVTEVEDVVASNLVPNNDADGNQIIDSLLGLSYHDTITDLDTFIAISDKVNPEMSAIEDDSTVAVVEEVEELPAFDEEITTIENDLMIVDFSNKGGRIQSVYFKEYVTYDDYVAEKKDPLKLFDENSTYGISYDNKGDEVNTSDLEFKIISQTAEAISLESTKNGKTVGFTYTMKPGKYDIDYDVYFKGFSDSEVEDAHFVADFKLLATEKHFPNEQRNSVTFFQYEEDSYDYIWMEDDLEFEENIEWISFKQSFFTAIISNKNNFSPKNSTIKIANYGDEEQVKYTKHYMADVNLGATKAENTVELNWYMGPVDYDILASYDNGTEDVVELGPGLFRWINKYAIRPLFTGLLGLGVSVGFAILLLTIVVKLILSPVNYKMYKSSAMMKVLKPEIEKINEKFPKKEDAMKKQQATMGLYRETGVSPLAGCVPMLIQMPILFAIFRLFPASIELRQKGFLWAEDLSSYDSPIQLGFEIPFYGSHVSIFTLLMAITTLVYTHYNSSNMQQPTQSGMPNMKYIMYFFPIMMIFFFNSYSSGLSFYYFISTLMTIGIMFAIKRFFIDEEKLLAKIEAKKANPSKKGKSKFAQRLEEAQRLQQEKAKNKKR